MSLSFAQRLQLARSLHKDPELLPHHMACKLPEWWEGHLTELRLLLTVTKQAEYSTAGPLKSSSLVEIERTIAKAKEALDCYRRAGWCSQSPTPMAPTTQTEWSPATDALDLNAKLTPTPDVVEAPPAPMRHVLNWHALGHMEAPATNEEFVRAIDYERLRVAFDKLRRQATEVTERADSRGKMIYRLRHRLSRTSVQMDYKAALALCKAELADCKAELERERRDAARYRVMRNSSAITATANGLGFPSYVTQEAERAELDAWLDKLS